MNKKHEEALPATERREILGSGASAAALAILGVAAVACSDDPPANTGTTSTTSGVGGGGPGSSSSSSAAMGGGGAGGEGGSTTSSTGSGQTADADIAPLNALLSAEYGAITAYTAGAGLITGAKESDPLYALRNVIVAVAVDFQSQHKLHAEALVAAIESLGGTPVDEKTVADSFTPPEALVANPSISNVLKFAASAERGAAVAYNQVLAGLEDAKFRFLATAIEGDESQHFIVLAALVLGLAAPGPELDETTAKDVVPEAFVTTVGSVNGLDKAPPDYFP